MSLDCFWFTVVAFFPNYDALAQKGFLLEKIMLNYLRIKLEPSNRISNIHIPNYLVCNQREYLARETFYIV